MIPLILLLVTPLQLTGAGFAALLSAVIAFAVYQASAKRRHEVTINGDNMRLLIFLTLFLTGLAFLSWFNAMLSLIIGSVGAAALLWHSFSTLRTALKR